VWWSYLIGLVAIVVMAVAWVWVQGAWRKTFPGASCDPDVLASRMGCHGCDCENICEERPKEAAPRPRRS
jgi:hypothetical protein